MTSPRPPRRRDSRDLSDLIRHNKQNLRQLDPGMVGGKFPPAKPPGRTSNDGDDDEEVDSEIQFLNSDHAVCDGPGMPIVIPLTHTPEPGSEQVYYNGTPLKWSDWTRTDRLLTIPGEPWFRKGKTAWVDYAYYDDDFDPDPPSFVGITLIAGDHTSIAIPAGTSPGDLLVLVLASRQTAGCSDSRMDGGYQPNPSGFVTGSGIWIGRATASTADIAITLTATSFAGDCVGALASFTGWPLVTTADTKSKGTASPFVPAVSGTASFGVAAIFGESALVSGTIQDEDTGTWTTRGRIQGLSSGKMSVYVGTAANMPTTGQWHHDGSISGWGARIVGLQ